MITPKHITVVGSGIIGLTTAITLLRKGFSVRILSKSQPLQTTSSKAAALWFPFEVAPVEKVDIWSGSSFRQYKDQMQYETTGIYMTSFLVLYNAGSNISWLQQLPEHCIRVARTAELPSGFDQGYMVTVPLVAPPQYLIYLLGQFRQLGGVYEERSVSSMEELSQLDGLVVNCTGLGARELCNDELLYPVRRQWLRAMRFNIPSMVDATKEGKVSYVMQRGDCTILGGTNQPNDWNERPTDEDTQSILSNLRETKLMKVEPEITSQIAGLSPHRETIRCEWDEQYTNVFHNYGHGSSGFTVAWGCAEEVAEWLGNYGKPLQNTDTIVSTENQRLTKESEARQSDATEQV